MATCSENEINLTALKRIDPKIVEIVGNASHICVYTYNIQQSEWVDIEIEGSLFIYKRSEIPFHGFVIMNRMNTTNLVEPFVQGLEFRKHEPYLMYQNQSGSIYCTWFYNLQDYMRVSALIQRIIFSKKGNIKLERKRSSSECGTMIKESPDSSEVKDVISMLAHAQKEYDEKNRKILESPDDQLTSGINGYRSPLTPGHMSVDSTNSYKGNCCKDLSVQSRRRFYSGNQATSIISDEEAIVGRPIFLVDHDVQAHSENSSHYITNGVSDHSPVSNDARLNDAISNNHATIKKVDFQEETNGWTSDHDSTPSTLTYFQNIPKSDHFTELPLSNHNGEVKANVFHKNIPDFHQCSKAASLGKCKKKLFGSDNGLLMNPEFHNNFTEVKQSLCHLLQMETSLVERIHNAHKSVQILQKKSHLHLSTTPELHI